MFGVCLANGVHGQSIGAGEHGFGDHYVNVDPDTTFNTSPFLPPVNVPIDFDADGTHDLTLTAFISGGLGGANNMCGATPSPGTAVAMGNTDSCFAFPGVFHSATTRVRRFDAGEMIGADAQWSTDPLPLSYLNFLMGSYSCSGNSFTSPGYLGIMITEQGDTAYGWIKLSGVSTAGFTLEEYAVSGGVSGIDPAVPVIGDHRFIQATDMVMILFDRPVSATTAVVVYDPRGALVARTMIPAGSSAGRIPTNDLGSGVYVVTMSGYHIAERVAVIH